MKTKFIRIIILLFVIVFSPLDTMANNDGYNWQTIDRIGLYNKKSDKQINKNIWKNYTQEDAVKRIHTMPAYLTSPAYRELASRFLLSEAPQSKDDITAPVLLTHRLDKLISYGLTEEANELYQKAMSNESVPTNFELSLIDIKLTLANGALAPICLDVQASSANFRDMPAWRELSHFCRLRFGSAEKIKISDFKFKHFPELHDILQSENLDLSKLKSNLSTLIAYSDNRVSEQSYDDNAQKVTDLSDLVIKLSLNNNYSKNETYQCYAIEGVKRGIINTVQLEDIYKNHPFKTDLLSHQSGEITLHPCHIPAYFYQLLNQTPDEDKSVLVDVMLKVTAVVPAIALSPMADFVKKYATNKKMQWRSDIITASAGKTLNDSSSPLLSIQKSESLSKKDYLSWLKTDSNDLFLIRRSLDLAVPHYISQTLSDKNKNFTDKARGNKYANIFSLTYAKKSLGLGLGFNDFITKAYNKNDHAMVITHLLGLIGHHDVQLIYPKDFAVILSGLKAYKLEKEAVAIAFEYLQ